MDMKREKQKADFRTEGKDVGEKLETLNARARAARNAPNVLGKAMESGIEAKAKRRRSSEGPASSNWKRGA